MKNQISHKLSYVFKVTEKAIFIKSTVDNPPETQVTYNKLPVSEDSLKFKIEYIPDSSAGIPVEKFPDETEIKTKIAIPNVCNTENLKAEITKYLRPDGVASKFEVTVVFKNPDGTIQDKHVTHISDDSDIDIL